MEVVIKQKGDEVVVKITGEVDNEAAEILRAELNKVVNLSPKTVIINMTKVPTMGSSGIGKILYFYKELNRINAKFAIKGIHESLYNIFISMKLERIFPISMESG